MKHVNLNSSIRREIVRRAVAQRRDNLGPAPSFTGLATAADLKQRDQLRRDEDAFRRQLTMALETFRNTTELVEDWPAIECYIPLAVSDPSHSVVLPVVPHTKEEEPRA